VRVVLKEEELMSPEKRAEFIALDGRPSGLEKARLRAAIESLQISC
jgi:hypothetical protein